MRILMLAGTALLLAITSLHADESARLTVKSLFKKHLPFNRHAEQVEYINSITIACAIDNQKLRDAHKQAFDSGKAEIGFDAMRDQLYLLGFRWANYLLPAGAHEQFCLDARAYWGKDDPSVWNAPIPDVR